MSREDMIDEAVRRAYADRLPGEVAEFRRIEAATEAPPLWSERILRRARYVAHDPPPPV